MPQLRFVALFAALLLYPLGEWAIFGSGWYPRFLDPDSFAGRLKFTLGTAGGRADIAVIGNSVLAEGFSAKSADAGSGGRMRFLNLSLPGSTPRCWYYLLRAADPGARRYRAIVLQADEYSDEDGFTPLADSITDVHIVTALLAPSDAFAFAFSYQNPRLRFEALRGALLKGYIFQQDARAFLEAPRERLQKVAQAEQGYGGWLYEYEGHRESLRGMSVDWSRGSIYLPPAVPGDIQQGLRQTVLRRRAPQTGAQAGYRRRWFGKILERYQDSGVRIVFIRPPRGPVVNPSFDSPDEPSTIRTFASRPNVTVVRADAFQPLETPDYFWDSLHMNAAGRKSFSRMLASELEPLVAKGAFRR
jgi:hypothetical protein